MQTILEIHRSGGGGIEMFGPFPLEEAVRILLEKGYPIRQDPFPYHFSYEKQTVHGTVSAILIPLKSDPGDMI